MPAKCACAAPQAAGKSLEGEEHSIMFKLLLLMALVAGDERAGHAG